MKKLIERDYNLDNLEKMDNDYRNLFNLLDEKTEFVSEKVTNALYSRKKGCFSQTEAKEACFNIEGSNPLTRFFLTLKNGLTREVTLEMDETKHLNNKFKKKAKGIYDLLNTAI